MSCLHLSHVFYLETLLGRFIVCNTYHIHYVSQASTLVGRFVTPLTAACVFALDKHFKSVSWCHWRDNLLTDVGNHIQKRKVSRFVICYPVRWRHAPSKISHGSASSKKNFNPNNSFIIRSLRMLESGSPWSLGSFPSSRFATRKH